MFDGCNELEIQKGGHNSGEKSFSKDEKTDIIHIRFREPFTDREVYGL